MVPLKNFVFHLGCVWLLTQDTRYQVPHQGYTGSGYQGSHTAGPLIGQNSKGTLSGTELHRLHFDWSETM